LEKVSKQGKQLVIMGDFNVNLLNTNNDIPTTNFIDILSSYLMLPHITLPTRVCDIKNSDR